MNTRGIADPLPSAGEVEQFGYCAHNWWLAQQGVDAGGQRGMKEHARQGRAQEGAERTRKESKRAMTWMFRILAMAGSATFLTLEVIFLRGQPLHWLFLATALVLVGASAALLVIAGIEDKEYVRRVKAASLVPGRVRRGGWHGEDVLHDPEWGISGAPDYVIDAPTGPVPVEVKTGHTPDHPYESHIMQLACYLRILEARGTPADYGLLSYPEGVFRVAWDADLQRRLRRQLDRMAQAKHEGKADRDHKHPARCRGCARRDACEQRLA